LETTFWKLYCYTTSFSHNSLYRSINSMNYSVYYLIHLVYSNVYNNNYLQFNILYLPIHTIIFNCHGLIITFIYNWEIHELPALTINSYQIIKYYYNNYHLSKRKIAWKTLHSCHSLIPHFLQRLWLFIFYLIY
jgi:hypothetical protein